MTDPTPLVRNTAPNDDTARPARPTGASTASQGLASHASRRSP